MNSIVKPMGPFALYLRYITISFKGQLQYKASFVMLALGHFLITFVEIIGIAVLFARFKTLAGWSLREVAVFYGLVNLSFALAESAGRGFDTFHLLVKSGDFDRLLLRPRSTALQVAARDFQLMRVGRLAQGLLVLVWGLSGASLSIGIGTCATLAFAVSGGAALFGGLFVLQATFSFWATETLEIFNTVTYGGTEAGQYPLPVYQKWFQRFFLFVVPLAAVTYFPVLHVTGRADDLFHTPAWSHPLAPVVGFLFLAFTLHVWRFGVRHYRSTGS